jgi:hypothetical protein
VTAPTAAASTPSPSPTITTSCLVPNVIGAGGANGISASAAVEEIDSAGLHAVVVLTKSDPAGGVAQGILWGENPAAGNRETCGSSVSLYFQPEP